MTTFSVDPTAVLDMAARLLGLREELDNAGDAFEGYNDAVGFAPLNDALGSFASNWSDKRRKVGELIGEVAGAAQAAGDAYQECEGELAGSFDDAAAATGSGG